MTNEFILSMSITFFYPDFSYKNFFMEMESTMIKISQKTMLPFRAVKKLLRQQSDWRVANGVEAERSSVGGGDRCQRIIVAFCRSFLRYVESNEIKESGMSLPNDMNRGSPQVPNKNIFLQFSFIVIIVFLVLEILFTTFLSFFSPCFYFLFT